MSKKNLTLTQDVKRVVDFVKTSLGPRGMDKLLFSSNGNIKITNDGATILRNIKKDGIDIPIHIGIAGPAKLQTLLKFSIECGIGASMKVLTKRAKDLTKLLLPYEPTKILQDLSDFKSKDPCLNIEKVHFFPIGGIKKTVDWVAEMHDQNSLYSGTN